MFSPFTPMRLTGCNGKTKKAEDGGKARVVVLTFMLQPFTPEMANDLNVKARLFSLSSGEPLQDIQDIGLKIAVPQQKMSLFEAPDVARASVVVDSVDVSPIIRVRADKEGPIYAATFNVSFDYPTAKELLWLFHRVTDQAFATFEPTGQQELPTGDDADDNE